VILSFPGLGVQLGARVLAEIGDDHARFADARGLKAYAGASPITRVDPRGQRSRPVLVSAERVCGTGGTAAV
jgi:transposase